jgi:hypothetical protein
MTRYNALYECYMTGQLPEADMARLMRDDVVFAAFVKRKDETRLQKGKR